MNDGSPWFPAEPPGTYLTLSLVGEPAHAIAEGIRLLGGVFRKLPRT